MTDHDRTEDFKTMCKPCVFAQFLHGIQCGCDLGKLDTYIDNGLTVFQEDGSYQIQTICNTCRGESWLKQQPLNTNLVAKVEEEVQISMAFIIVAVGCNRDDIMRLLPQRISECVNQKQIRPSQIVVVVKSDDVKSSELYELLDSMCENIPRRLVKILDQDSDMGRCIDIGVQNVSNSRYYCTIYLGHNIPLNTIKILNDLINTDLRTVSMVQPEHEYSGLIVQTMLHKIFGGNKGQPIHTKILQASILQNKPHVVLTLEELWNYPKSAL